VTRVTLKWRGNVLFRAVNNLAFVQIIWRHFDEHLVAGEHTELHHRATDHGSGFHTKLGGQVTQQG
jgi:hypothetical protein